MVTPSSSRFARIGVRRPGRRRFAGSELARLGLLSGVLILGFAGCETPTDQWMPITPSVRPSTVTLPVWWVAPTRLYPDYVIELARACHEPVTSPRFQAMVRPYGGLVIASSIPVFVSKEYARALVPKGLVVANGDRVEIRSGDKDFCHTGRLTHVVRIVRRGK